ncbi:MAG: aspartyl-tRNA(Asn)/glutamyl-tRNA(Gln) amidotransferase subunit [Clostridia bacterium]|nr:aspartyl-tRNA(Asn)/glutamyl-tRNA(Gln) amidotransferase subunit [Clostridia bacterium]
MRITKKDVEHVALLSRLDLTEEEKEAYTKQLNSIIDYMNKINELDTEGVEPTAHVLPIYNVMREDEVGESLDREKVLENAPEKEDGQFKVPRIV